MSLLDTDNARKIGRECFDASTDWLNAGRRMAWGDSLRAFQGLHPSGSKYLSTDYRYRSRLFRPKTRSMVRKAEAATAAAFFSNEDVVSITAQDDDDPQQKASADIMQRLLQYRLTKTIPWFQTVVGARQDAEVMGICLGKVYWRYEEKFNRTESRPKLGLDGMPTLDDGGGLAMDEFDIYDKMSDHPWIDLIAPENFRFDPGADWRNPIATSPYTIELIPMYVADVWEKVKSEEWLGVSLSQIMAAAGTEDMTTRYSREQNRIPGKEAESGKPRMFDICWVRENIIRSQGVDYHYFTLNNSGELLTNPRPVQEVYLQGIRPYVCGSVVTEAHKTYPTSKVELIKDIQTQVNDVTNLGLDNIKLALNPRQFVKGGQGLDLQDLRTFMPGKTVITTGKDDPRNVIIWDRPPDMTGSAYQEQDRLNMEIEELVGGVSNSSIQGNRQVYEAVGNMELMAGVGSQIEEYDQRVFSETFIEPIIRQLVKLEQAYETDPVILAMAGKEAQLWQKYGINHITDELLKHDLTIKVNVGIGATNPKTKLQNFMTAAEALEKIYGEMAAVVTEPEEIIKEIFGLCGYKDGLRFFPKGIDFKQVMQQMLQAKTGGKQQTNPQQEAQADMQRIQAEQQSKIAVATATQQAQAQQDTESHKMDMVQQQQAFQFKLQEQLQKHQLEMEKTRAQMAMQNHQQMQQMASKPVQLHSDDLKKSSDNVGQMAQHHTQAMDALGRVLAPLAHATIQHGKTLEQMLGQNQHGHAVMTDAINRLTQAHLTPKKRRALRDENGKLIGAEEYV